ncbi:hypothetical protein VKT23_009924 [Stygiomarasmius scandens]|uniref:C2H2-type domain-containing protein n=1 Tax=Marasmiellus scandens TaxID=2682957 RepID=A0ABR1JCI0_9AGAR
MPICTQCNRSFQSDAGLRSHCTAKQDHSYCLKCNVLFPSVRLFKAHCDRKLDHHMHYCADCDILTPVEYAGKHLASRRHLCRAPAQPNVSAPAGILSTLYASPLSIQEFPTTPFQQSSASTVTVPPWSPRLTRVDKDRNVVESDINDYETDTPALVNPSFAEPISASTASAEDETTLRVRMETPRQHEAIAAQIRELERQEEEFRPGKEQPTSEVASPPPALENSVQPQIAETWSYCLPCDQLFDSVDAFRTHCADKRDHAYCLFCEKWFDSMPTLQQHLASARDARDPAHNYEPDYSQVTEPEVRAVKVKKERVQCREAPQVPVISNGPEWGTQCIICLKKFKCKTALLAHQRDKETCRKALAAA